jgi:hypothetical protein
MVRLTDREVTCPHCQRRHVLIPPMPPDVIARTQAHGMFGRQCSVACVDLVPGRVDRQGTVVEPAPDHVPKGTFCFDFVRAASLAAVILVETVSRETRSDLAPISTRKSRRADPYSITAE